MSIYCLTQGIPILSSGVNEYKDIYMVLDGWHELIGVDALSRLNTRDQRVRELEEYFQVKWRNPYYTHNT
jgi:adenylosuccinate synthase